MDDAAHLEDSPRPLDLGAWFPPAAFAGNVALVTGGGTGLGLEISRGLARLGARVAIASRDPEHHAPLLEEAAREGWAAEAHVVDLRDIRPVEMGDRVVLVRGSDIYTPLRRDDGVNVVRFEGAEDVLASGYLWEENRRQLAYKPFAVVQARGDGMVIGFTQDPTVRAYLDGLNVLLMNAIFRGAAHARPVR